MPHRALLPQLASKPVTICSQCHEKLNKETLRNQRRTGNQITKISIGNNSYSSHIVGVTPSSTNWWGDGLPPPSMRSVIGQPCPPPRMLHGINKKQTSKTERNVNDTTDLEARLMRSREDDVPENVLTLSEIEERLAALRGCDVELIRQPRCIFESVEKPRPTGDTIEQLLKEARDLAVIEDRHNPVADLERRHKRLREEGDEPSDSAKAVIEDESSTSTGLGTDMASQRLSKVSTTTSFSETTTRELEDVNRLMEDAQKRINASEADEKRMEQEMKNLLAAARQKSLELEEVNREIGKLWDKQLDKMEVSESDDESLDDETVKKIILEAEQSAIEIPNGQPSASTSTPENVGSSKKTGLFTRIFRR